MLSSLPHKVAFFRLLLWMSRLFVLGLEPEKDLDRNRFLLSLGLGLILVNSGNSSIKFCVPSRKCPVCFHPLAKAV